MPWSFEGEQKPPLVGGDGKYRQPVAAGGQGEAFAKLLGVLADFGQRDQAPQLALEGDVDQEPARLFARGPGVVIMGFRIELGFVGIGRAGHAGDPGNEMADRLANEGIATLERVAS